MALMEVTKLMSCMRVSFMVLIPIVLANNSFFFVWSARGRHDPCVVPRAVPIVEAMAALVLADAAMIQFGRERSTKP